MSTKSSKTTGGRAGLTKTQRGWPPKSILQPEEGHHWSRTVVFDLHNTLVNWTSAFIQFANTIYGYDMDPSKQRFYSFQMDPDNPLSNAEFVDLFVAFARRHDGGYGDLEPYEGAIEAIKAIKAAGIEVKVWTWTPGAAESRLNHSAGSYNHGVAQGETRKLIAKLGLDPDRDLRFISPGSKKYEMVSEHIPLIVEDSPETAVGVGQMAHAAILVPEEYTKGVKAPNVLRLDHRSQLAPTVIRFFEELDAAGKLL